MAEVAPAGGGGGINRTFLLIVGGLAALLVIGLLAVGALLFLPSMLGGPKPSPVAQATMTPTRIAIQPTASPTKATPVPTATFVVLAAPTNTPVISGTNGTPTSVSTQVASAAGTVTNAPEATAVTGKGGQPVAEATPTTEGQMPESGFGENLLLLAGGLVLVVVLFAVRRARVSS